MLWESTVKHLEGQNAPTMACSGLLNGPLGTFTKGLYLKIVFSMLAKALAGSRPPLNTVNYSVCCMSPKNAKIEERDAIMQAKVAMYRKHSKLQCLVKVRKGSKMLPRGGPMAKSSISLHTVC